MDMRCSIFTKPWPQLSVDELGVRVSQLGFDGVELPVRPGFQLEPDQVEQGLPRVAARLAAHGVSIMSVAGSLDEPFFAGCQAAGVPLIRVMANFKGETGYFAAEAAMRAQLEAALPLSEKYGVKIGVQQHYGTGVFNAMELRHLLDGFDRDRVGAIWDAAHSGLAGEDAAKGLSIVWDYLCLVNLKAAYYRRVNGPEAEQARFKPYFTTARHGNTDWATAIAFCHAHGYQGPICFPAEYTDEANVLTYIAQDLAYAKSLMQQYA